MNNKPVFSRYTHEYAKEGKVALFNSLRLRPVFISQRLYDLVKSYINEGNNNLSDTDLSLVKSTVEELKKQKVLIPDAKYDDMVIDRFKAITGKPAIRVAYFIMTDKCNFNCSYCFMMKEQEKGHLKKLGKMKPEVAKLALNTFAKWSYTNDEDDRMIIFYGGEPLLNFPIIKQIVLDAEKLKEENKLAQDTKFAIVTNGSLLTDEIAVFMKEHKIGIGISIDGDSLVTNSSRVFVNGEPTFDKIMQAIDTCKRNGCDDFSLSVTISKSCLENFDNTIDFLVNKVESNNIGYNILMNLDGDEKESEEYAIAASKFIIKSFEIFRKKGIYEDRIMRKVKSFVDGKVHLFDCAACGGNQLVFAPDGSIGICHGFLGTKNYFSGSIFDPDFSPEKNQDFLEWSKRSPVNMEECQDCPALGICGGGCPFNAYQQEKNIWALDKRFCIHAKMTLEWLIWDLYQNSKKERQ